MDEVYKAYFLQRLEKLNLEFMGRLLDSETQRALLEVKLVETQKLYEESQNQVEIQNDLMKQAANSIEQQTNDSSKYGKLLEQTKKDLAEKESQYMQVYYESKEKDTKIEQLTGQLSQIDMFRNELNSVRMELNATYAELQDTKSELEKYVIKPKKKPKLEVVGKEEDDF